MARKNSAYKAFTDMMPVLNSSTKAVVQSRSDAAKTPDPVTDGEENAANADAVLRLHKIITRVEEIITTSEKLTAQFLALVKARKNARKQAKRGNA